jgi:hypothetical protein
LEGLNVIAGKKGRASVEVASFLERKEPLNVVVDSLELLMVEGLNFGECPAFGVGCFPKIEWDESF